VESHCQHQERPSQETILQEHEYNQLYTCVDTQDGGNDLRLLTILILVTRCDPRSVSRVRLSTNLDEHMSRGENERSEDSPAAHIHLFWRIGKMKRSVTMKSRPKAPNVPSETSRWEPYREWDGSVDGELLGERGGSNPLFGMLA